MRAEIVRIATTRPQLLKEPYTRWSLRTLRAYLLRTKVVSQISTERLREILAEEKVSIQRTKSWKRSPDPDFDAKAARVLELYHALPDVVVCFDELGPVRPIPTAGWGWAPAGRPKRLPANYKKPHGVRFFFGCYDVGTDQLFGLWFPAKGAANVVKTLRLIRRRYPGHVRIHIVMDNLSSHWTQDVLAWALANNADLVPTPTYASWLNRIEPQFGVMVKLLICGSDYAHHAELQRAASAFLRRRNYEARRDFDHRQQEKAKRRVWRATDARAWPWRSRSHVGRHNRDIVAIPESVRRTLTERLSARRRERWPQLADIRVRFRGQFAYVDGVLPDGDVIPLCRLTYQRSADTWGFAAYLASKDGYENSVLPTGSFTGLPENALDTACGLYLGDVSAWAELFAFKRSPPTH